jgi:hypothetical protein
MEHDGKRPSLPSMAPLTKCAKNRRALSLKFGTSDKREFVCFFFFLETEKEGNRLHPA